MPPHTKMLKVDFMNIHPLHNYFYAQALGSILTCNYFLTFLFYKKEGISQSRIYPLPISKVINNLHYYLFPSSTLFIGNTRDIVVPWFTLLLILMFPL